MQLGSDRVRLRTLEEKGRNLRLEEQLASVIPAVISHRDHIPRVIRLGNKLNAHCGIFWYEPNKLRQFMASRWALRGSKSIIGDWQRSAQVCIRADSPTLDRNSPHWEPISKQKSNILVPTSNFELV